MALPNEIHPFAIAGGGNQYQIANSLRFRASNSAYLSRTPASSSNQQIMTLSSWVKISDLSNYFSLLGAQGSAQGNQRFHFYIGNNYQMGVQYTAIQTATYISVYSTDVFRDPSAWYHFVFAIDLTQASYTNAIKMWVNNRAITSFGGTTYTSGYSPPVNSSSYTHYIGRYYDSSGGAIYGGGYMAETNFVDGQQLDPTYFGQTDSITGIWSPKKYTGTYGTNGFYLPFNDATSTTTIGYDRQLGMSDSSKNNWTASGISVTSGTTYDVMIDSPTNYNDGGNNRGNYCTWNAAQQSTVVNGTVTRSNGNLTSSDGGTTYGLESIGTIAASSGKWYWEVTLTYAGSIYANIGVVIPSSISGSSHSGIIYTQNGNKYNGADTFTTGAGGTAYGSSYTQGDIISVALDIDNGTITFYKNGVSQGVAYSTGITGSSWTPAVGDGQNASQYTFDLNCGQRPFTYTPPTGYKALNTYNLADPSLPLV